MKERSRQCVGVNLEVSQDPRYRERVNDVQRAVLTLLVPVCLICENKCLSEHGIIFLDIFLIEICSIRIAVVGIEDIREAVFILLGDLGNLSVILKVCTLLSLCLRSSLFNGIQFVFISFGRHL